MKPDSQDDLIRAALAELPEAPRDRAFQARIMAVAALTPQDGGKRGEAVSSGLLFLLRSGGAALGFTLGIVAILLIGYLEPEMEDREKEPSLVASLASVPLDPLETVVSEMVSARNTR